MSRTRPPQRPLRRWLPAALLLAWLISALYAGWRPLPDGLSMQYPARSTEDLQLLVDLSWQEADGQLHSQQQIFDETLAMIAAAERFILLDMFLFNDFAGSDSYRALSGELTSALLQARQRNPQMPVVLITDPFNTLYGGLRSPHLEQLEQAGVQLVFTDLQPLRASNPLWTGLWQLCCQWLGNSPDGGWLPNPVGPGKVSLRSYLHLLNFRANHRKTLVTGLADSCQALVGSANPHDASSRHANQALRFAGGAAADLLDSELALLPTPDPRLHCPTGAPAETDSHLQVLTEGAIARQLLALVNSSQAGDRLDLEVFYLSHRALIEALQRAQQRGVAVRVLLDANRDAFGRQKNGIPNRQAAWDLQQAGIAVRWCASSGEQCHRKWLLLQRTDGSAALLAGSANFTRRNLDDLNLETSVLLQGPAEEPSLQQALTLFERLWSNQDREWSLPYAQYADHSRWRYLQYRVMEASGLSTF
ncbi:MAG: phospholipase D-like domain-containing protein [Halopseudomonas yangmingensis]